MSVILSDKLLFLIMGFSCKKDLAKIGGWVALSLTQSPVRVSALLLSAS